MKQLKSNNFLGVKLSGFPSRTKKEWKLIDKKPMGDKDRDKLMNWFDCKPLNKRKQGFGHPSAFTSAPQNARITPPTYATGRTSDLPGRDPNVVKGQLTQTTGGHATGKPSPFPGRDPNVVKGQGVERSIPINQQNRYSGQLAPYPRTEKITPVNPPYPKTEMARAVPINQQNRYNQQTAPYPRIKKPIVEKPYPNKSNSREV